MRKRAESVATPRRRSLAHNFNKIEPRMAVTEKISLSAPFYKERVNIRNVSQVFNELLQTEESYVKDLRIIVEEFQRPLSEGILLPKEVKSIFSNIHRILPVNDAFLSRLYEIEKESKKVLIGDNTLGKGRVNDMDLASVRLSVSVIRMNTDFADLQERLNSVMIEGVCRIFQEYLGNPFQEYLVYCSSMVDLHSTLDHVSSTIPAFQLFLHQQLQNEVCRMMDIHSFLVMPMQRIMRYPLFLKELLKSTPMQSEAHKTLKEVIMGCEKIIAKINYRTKLVGDLGKLVNISKKLYIPISKNCQEYLLVSKTNKGGLPLADLDILASHRIILAQGKVTITPNQYGDYIILCNDICVLCQTTDQLDDPFIWVIRRAMSRKTLMVSDGLDVDLSIQVAEVGFQLFSLLFTSKRDKKKWMKAFKTKDDAPRPSTPTRRVKSVSKFSLLSDSPRADSPRPIALGEEKESQSAQAEGVNEHFPTPVPLENEMDASSTKKRSNKAPVPLENERDISPTKKRNKMPEVHRSSIFSFWKTKVDKPATPKRVTNSTKGQLVKEQEKNTKLEAKLAELEKLLKEKDEKILQLQQIIDSSPQPLIQPDICTQ